MVGNRRGSLFLLCRRSEDDRRYPRYPPLPVVSCEGYEQGKEDPWKALEDPPGGDQGEEG